MEVLRGEEKTIRLCDLVFYFANRGFFWLCLETLYLIIRY